MCIAGIINTEYTVKFLVYDLLLMMMCLAGFSTCQIIMLVSKLPLATNRESGDHATQFTLALWKPHSLSLAS